MRKLIYLFIAVFLFGACNKELDLLPRTDISTDNFFNNENDLKLYCNGFYDGILPTSETTITGDGQSDNVEGSSPNLIVQGKHIEPSTGGGWSWTYLRKVNYFLENYERASVTPAVANHYAGVARLFRAWFYFEKVKRFGDVPWYSKVLTPDDPDLFKSRDSRIIVMKNVLDDLKFATENMNATGADGEVNKWVAYALRARISLHEGTFRKYHGIEGANEFLQDAYMSANEVMNSGKFKLYQTGKPKSDYGDLFVLEYYDKGEVLLAKRYNKTLNPTGHTASYIFTTATSGGYGMTRSMINSYLMKDGTPFTQQPSYQTMMLMEETANRDPRLSQTIRTPGYMRYGSSIIESPFQFFGATVTGYMFAKHVAGKETDSWQTNFNDIAIIRYAEVLLIYAEAKSELGILTADDLTKSINLIRSRAGMPSLSLNVGIDPVLESQYPNITGGQKALILEIRRERRVELVMENFRYDDLMRWKRGPLLALQFTGMYFPNMGAFDVNGDGKIDVEIVSKAPSPTNPDKREYIVLKDSGPVLSEGTKGYLIAHPISVATKDKTFDESKHYYFPLPLSELFINPNLKQNPGWLSN